MENKIIYLKDDLPSNVNFKNSIAIDTEMTGLSLLSGSIQNRPNSHGDTE